MESFVLNAGQQDRVTMLGSAPNAELKIQDVSVQIVEIKDNFRL